MKPQESAVPGSPKNINVIAVSHLVPSIYLYRCFIFFWPCIIVYRYNETNVMHFSFNLLRIKGLHMFHSINYSSSAGAPKKAFGILRACYVSWLWHGCSETATVTLYARNIPNAVCESSPEDEQVMLWNTWSPLILNKLNEKCITLVSFLYKCFSCYVQLWDDMPLKKSNWMLKATINETHNSTYLPKSVRKSGLR
jgi:hypothetical protein